MNKKLFRIIVVFFISFLLCSCVGGCLEWLKGLCSRWTISSNVSISSNNHEINKTINEKKYTHEDLYIIGDMEKCKKVIDKLDAGSYSESTEVIVYNKEILDDEGYYNTFRFYLCGNRVVECEKIYKSNKEQSSYFFFFVDVTDSKSLNNLDKVLPEFKKIFEIEISRFFLILLKTDSQEDRKITAEEAEKFCDNKDLKFFGEIDIKNNIWDIVGKDSIYEAIIEICAHTEIYSGLCEEKYDEENDSTFYEIKDEKDIFIMFLYAVREAIRNKEGQLEVHWQELLGKIHRG